MPSVGPHCHELRITDEESNWRVIYRLDEDAVINLEVFLKKSQRTPREIIDVCKKRIKRYDE